MKRLLLGTSLLAGLCLVLAPPSYAQKSGGSSSSGCTSGCSGTGGQSGPTASAPATQSPTFVNGRVIMETGQPSPEPVIVSLVCGMRALQVIHTDLKGYFGFVLGAGAPGNSDFDVSENNVPGILNSSGPSDPSSNNGAFNASGDQLSGCEVRLSVPGYQPLSHVISDPSDLSRIEIGTLQLVRLSNVSGSAISVTSMLVPAAARKEYDDGEKELRANHLKPAGQHFEKAVAQYDKYAAAWGALGNVDFKSHDPDKARQCFEKAIAVDAQYVPPYIDLANLDVQTDQFQPAIEAAQKAEQLDPTSGDAYFLDALANAHLNRADDVERAGIDTEKREHSNVPQVHALLAQLYLQRQEFSNAEAQIRAYLKEAPQGPLAAEMKKNLEDAEKSASASNNSGGKAEIAP